MLFLFSQAIFIALFSSVMGLGGCVLQQHDAIQGSGVAKTETRDVAEFTKVELTGSPDVTITIGDKQSLTIEADDNILPLLTTEVKNGKLVIGSQQNTSYSPKTDIKITITVAKLEGASVVGSGDIKASGVKADTFEASVTGSGDLDVSGEADSLKATVRGSGDLDATKLAAEQATVTVQGSGDAKVHATKSLDARIEGSGDVQYTGNPSDVHEQVQGSGSVRKA